MKLNSSCAFDGVFTTATEKQIRTFSVTEVPLRAAIRGKEARSPISDVHVANRNNRFCVCRSLSAGPGTQGLLCTLCILHPSESIKDGVQVPGTQRVITTPIVKMGIKSSRWHKCLVALKRKLISCCLYKACWQEVGLWNRQPFQSQ